MGGSDDSAKKAQRAEQMAREQRTLGILLALLLAAAGLFRPRIAAALLRTMDVPPISGGPGMSRVGGFFTIVWIWAYSTIVVALVMQFLLYNSDTVGSLNPTANNHIQTTSFTLKV